MTSANPLRKDEFAKTPGRTTALALLLVFLPTFFLVVLSHWTLLHLPYFWDEGGYYVPAALDFFRTGTLIPAFTNAHPPLPSVLLGTLWHLFGFHVLVTHVTACAFAAAGLTAVHALARKVVGQPGAALLVILTACYPIWFAQSSLAHADIFAAAFTLGGFFMFLTSPEIIGSPDGCFSSKLRLRWCSLLFCLSVLSKETAVIQPAALAGLAMYVGYHCRRFSPSRSRAFWSWAGHLLLPVPVLALWFSYHFLKTGHFFGNPVYLRYNATDNFTLAHVLYALRIRFVHLFWQRNIWVPIALAAACLMLPPREPRESQQRIPGLPRLLAIAIGILVITNLVAFSILGGALLTRYLLPVYPLILMVCIAMWRDRLTFWPWLGVITAGAFIPAIWLNPSTFFAPEDNLTYRNMVVVQQQAINYLNQHYPDATVLTAWPVAADLYRPELGYTERRFKVVSLENFTAAELAKAASEPGRYDTALVFTTHYTSPAFRNFLLTHPTSWRVRRYAADLDLSPAAIARTLGGDVVWQHDLYGEWAAVIRFHRTYDAALHAPNASSDPGQAPFPRSWPAKRALR